MDMEIKMEAIEEFVLDALCDFNKRLKQVETGVKEKMKEEISALEESVSLKLNESVSKTVESELGKVKEDLNETFSEGFSEFKLNVSTETQESVTKTVQAEIVKVKEELLQEKNANEGIIEKTQTRPPMWQYMETHLTSTPKQKPMVSEYVIIPKYVSDLKDSSLRSELSNLETKVNYSKERERLTPVQLYNVYFWWTKNNHPTGRVDEIEQLIHNGIKDGLWPRDWKPDSVTGTMKSYLTEKVKSFNKKIKIDNKKREYREKLTEKS